MPMATRPLTQRQELIYDFIKDRILNGLPPTVREIGIQFDIASPNGVMCHLKALERKGLIKRSVHLSRGIELTENPHDVLTKKCRHLVDLRNKQEDLGPVIDEICELVR